MLAWFYLSPPLHWYLLCAVEALHFRKSCHACHDDPIYQSEFRKKKNNNKKSKRQTNDYFDGIFKHYISCNAAIIILLFYCLCLCKQPNNEFNYGHATNNLTHGAIINLYGRLKYTIQTERVANSWNLVYHWSLYLTINIRQEQRKLRQKTMCHTICWFNDEFLMNYKRLIDQPWQFDSNLWQHTQTHKLLFRTNFELLIFHALKRWQTYINK